MKDRYIVWRKFPVRAGRGWVIAHHGDWHRPQIVSNIYGRVLWLGPVGIGYVR